MKIRESIISDISHLETLFLITRLSTFSSRRKECQIVDYIQSTVDDKVWVGEVDGAIVGFISLYPQDNFIHNLFIDPKYQGQGFGKKLLLFAEEKLGRPMTLKVAMDNLKVYSFYEKYVWYNAGEFNEAPEPYILSGCRCC